MNSAIELNNVGWKAGKSFELQDVSLRVPVGSIYGFLGPNGSGKTTTIRIFMGMMRPDHGEISVLGRSVPGDMKSILARVGYVPERPHVYPALTVGEQVKRARGRTEGRGPTSRRPHQRGVTAGARPPQRGPAAFTSSDS